MKITIDIPEDEFSRLLDEMIDFNDALDVSISIEEYIVKVIHDAWM